MNLKKNATIIAAAAALSLAAGASFGQNGKEGARALLSSADGSIQVTNPKLSEAPKAAIQCQSFAGQASWDGPDDVDNIILNLNIGAGNTLTGVGWDIGIATIGGSWLSEATILHSDSTGTADPNGIALNIGADFAEPGDQDFTSGGAIVDFSDNGLPEITAGADGILQLQLYESFDDNADAIDANYRNAAAPQLCAGLALACTDQISCNLAVGGRAIGTPVPANSPWALILMAMVLAGLGIVAVRRFA